MMNFSILHANIQSFSTFVSDNDPIDNGYFDMFTHCLYPVAEQHFGPPFDYKKQYHLQKE